MADQRRTGFAVETRGHLYPVQLGQPLRVGREAHCEICLDAPAVSRIHAWFWMERGEVYVEDLGSRNGMYVNGARVQGRVRLGIGDRIVIGDRTLTLAADDRELLDTPLQMPAVTPGQPVRPTDTTTSVDKVFLDAAAQASREGRFKEAADSLRHFFQTVEALSSIAPVGKSVVDAAAPLVMDISRGVGDAIWIDRFLRVRRLLNHRLAPEPLRALAALIADLPQVKDGERRAYVSWARAQASDEAEREAIELLGSARGR